MPRDASGDARRGVWAAYAAFVVRLRVVIVVGWALVVALALWAPASGGGGGDLDGFVNRDDPAIAAEVRSFEIFGFPLLSRTAIVQRDPDGLSTYAQAEAVLRGIGITQGSYDTKLLGALPVPNTFALFPRSQERGTTVVTYVFSHPSSSFRSRQKAAEDFAAEHLRDPDDAYVGVTGSAPARAEQAHLLEEALPLVEMATIAAILLIVGLTFRSVVAPIVAILAAGASVVVTLYAIGYVADLLDVSVPSELEPLIVALLLGVVTDYSIFFLSGMRHRLTDGFNREQSARIAAADVSPIVVVAAITVAAGTGALLVAKSALFRGFGPGMALAVLISALVTVTFVPALLALLGRRAYWPVAPSPRAPEEVATPPRPSRLTVLVTRRRSAVVVSVATGLLLVVAAVPLMQLNLGLSFVLSLPDESRVSVAARHAQDGFAEGILSPTELLLEDEGIGQRRRSLEAFGAALEAQPGVAGVIGPGDIPVREELGLLVARSGDAARYLVVFDSPALGASAIDKLAALDQQLPSLLAKTGLANVRVGVAGDTALSRGVVEGTTADLQRITFAALLVNLLMLVIFLRAFVAPLYLLACSVLALGASLGLTVFTFQTLLGQEGLTFYVPFAAAILLLALGSDYNIFAVGHIWERARKRPLRQAMTIAIPESTRAIVAAGLALAASFGLLALVPLRPFRELAFAMSLGILLDVLVVRSLLIPALITLVGPKSGWPWAGLRGSSSEKQVEGVHREDAGV